VDALLERLAGLYYGLGALVALLPAARHRALGGAGLVLLGLASAANAVAFPGAAAGFVTINELLALSGALLVAGALVSALTRKRSPDAAGLPAPGLAPLFPSFDLLLLSGLLLAALAPWILLLGLGAALALASATRAALRSRRPLGLLLLLPASAALGSGLALLLTILGPEGGRVAALGEGPLSLAAERLLTLLLGGAALALAGLPPLHRVAWGRSLAPLSAILLLRIVLPGFPAGLLTWQVAAFLLLAVSMSWSALTGRWGQAAISGGLMALWSGGEGAIPGAVLVAWGCSVEIGNALAQRRGVVLSERWRGLATIPAALAGLPALRAGLRAQVLFSVLAVAACGAGLLLQSKRDSHAVPAPLY